MIRHRPSCLLATAASTAWHAIADLQNAIEKMSGEVNDPCVEHACRLMSTFELVAHGLEELAEDIDSGEECDDEDEEAAENQETN